MKGLTKENFWNDLMAKYPSAVKKFCDWIDEYKKEVGWDSLFGNHLISKTEAIKFHDLPYDMQNGILARFDLECFNGKGKADAVRNAEPGRITDLFADLESVINKRKGKLN